MSRGPNDGLARFFADLRVLPDRFAGDVADGLRAFQQGMNAPRDRRPTQFFAIITIALVLSVVMTLMVRQ